MTKLHPQKKLFKRSESAFGGSLMTTAKGRSMPRPLATGKSMHLVLRSSKARGEWSFKNPKNARMINAILNKFSKKHAVQVLSMANVGNHLHLQIKLGKRELYRPFIKAVTGAIAMAVTGINARTKRKPESISAEQKAHDQLQSHRQKRQLRPTTKSNRLKFWDYRPFTRIIMSFKELLTLRDYIQINHIESYGFGREQAIWLLKRSKNFSIVKGFG